MDGIIYNTELLIYIHSYSIYLLSNIEIAFEVVISISELFFEVCTTHYS